MRGKRIAPHQSKIKDFCQLPPGGEAMRLRRINTPLNNHLPHSAGKVCRCALIRSGSPSVPFSLLSSLFTFHSSFFTFPHPPWGDIKIRRNGSKLPLTFRVEMSTIDDEILCTTMPVAESTKSNLGGNQIEGLGIYYHRRGDGSRYQLFAGKRQ